MIRTEQMSNEPVEGERTRRISPRGKLAYGMMLAGSIVLAATGIGTFVLGEAPMTQWVLMAHVSAAPLFAIGLALVGLTWADRCRLGRHGSRHSGAAKTLFWLILSCGVVVILSGVLPMTPLFGTDEQHALYLTHRYSGIVLAGTLALHLLSLRRNRR
jgi:cytochrome b subunit of formate dehydrogenase